MRQLLEFKIKPFEAIQFRQSARLVSSDAVAIEKQKALARKTVFANSAAAGIDTMADYKNMINRTFSSVSSPLKQTASRQSSPSKMSVSIPQPMPGSLCEPAGTAAVSAEAQANYFQQRGQLEIRVAAGELSYIPAIEMTVITSWPEVDYTYTGGFHYAPPLDKEGNEEKLNLTT